MGFNNRNLIAILMVVSIQIAGGIKLANAMQCEKEIEQQWAQSDTSRDGKEYWGLGFYGNREKSLDEIKSNYEQNLKFLTSPDSNNSSRQNWETYNGGNYKSCSEFSLTVYNEAIANNRPGNACVAKYLADNNCKNVSLVNPTNNSSQQNNSRPNTSSNQSTSPQPSAQSENSQTNAQTTTSKKGKKNPNNVPANCVGFNHDKTKIVNKCNFPINFTFCMLHQDDQSIPVANSCNNGFVEETVYPGRAISDESLDTRFFAVSCKFPSKPIKTRFISFNEPLEGNCPR